MAGQKIIVFLFLLACVPARAVSDSLFEWGFFVGHGNTADYPASNEYRLRTLPVPYVRYRGEILRNDNEDGARVRMFRTENFDLDFSFGGSFPTEGDKNQARLGMPELDFTLEVGPRLLYYFIKNQNNLTIRAGLPLRYSMATNFTKWSEVGYVFAPTIQMDRYNFLTNGLNLYGILDFNYYSEGEADYFFQVDPQYQTPTRRTYNAKAGYVGYNVALAAKYDFKQMQFILGSRYSDYSDSVNRESDLHKSSVNWTYFVGIGWMLFKSEQKAFD